MKLYSPSEADALIKRYGFKISKSLGQNFLTDKNIIDNIIAGTEIGKDDLIIEIGPGMGVLTRELANAAKKVVAVEIDSGLMPILDETLADFDNVEVLNEDILKTDLKAIIDRNIIDDSAIRHVKIVGNLPYYIATPIIIKILEDALPVDSITVMIQKEVADRISAPCGSKTYGVISLVVQYYCKIKKICTVSRNVFRPVPKVDSTVLRFDIRKEKPVSIESEKAFFACIKAGFGQRRKTLINSMAGAFGKSKTEIGRVFCKAGIDSCRRAETLDIAEFAALADELIRAGILQR